MEAVDVTSEAYRAARGRVQRWDGRRLALRARTLLHRRQVYGLSEGEAVELRAVVDEHQVRGQGLLA